MTTEATARIARLERTLREWRRRSRHEVDTILAARVRVKHKRAGWVAWSLGGVALSAPFLILSPGYGSAGASWIVPLAVWAALSAVAAVSALRYFTFDVERERRRIAESFALEVLDPHGIEQLAHDVRSCPPAEACLSRWAGDNRGMVIVEEDARLLRALACAWRERGLRMAAREDGVAR